jgi:myo-inositol 2-dehydrogenase / D-chiro-inositol 1-dehydrogenase
MHFRHRAPHTLPGFTEQMLISESVVHEFDITRWLLGEEITAVTVKKPRASTLAPDGLGDPQLVLIESSGGTLVDVEININAQFGYQVAGQVVFEGAAVDFGASTGLATWHDGALRGTVAQDFRPRFEAAYHSELTDWVQSVRTGTLSGPSAWDGYAAAVACTAGIEAQHTGRRVEIPPIERPAFYH